MRTVIHILSNTKLGTLPGSILQSVDERPYDGARSSMPIDALQDGGVVVPTGAAAGRAIRQAPARFFSVIIKAPEIAA
jgi:hypothetical protein